MSDTLAEICAVKRDHIARAKAARPESHLRDAIARATAPRGFRQALQRKIEQGDIGLIAEIKKASPSKGLIRADFHPASLALAYQEGGAACLSVLTDTPYFQGEDAYLPDARIAVSLPVLRKDFMLDTYQVSEARALGADCILLIMAALSDGQAKELEAAAFELGMDVLVEVHNEEEMARALSELQSRLLGINNRNLKTLQVDLATSEIVAAQLPKDFQSNSGIVVCESGIATPQDIARMQKAGIHCFLVGESLMRQADVAMATQTLIGNKG